MKLTQRDRVLLGVLAAVLVAFGFYKFLLTPQHRAAARLQTQIAAAQTALGKAQREEASGHADEVALRKTQRDWNAAERAVPAVANIPGLLKLLARSASAAHVSMQSISLSSSDTAATGGIASTTTTGATAGAASSPTVTEIPVSLTFNGGYQALNRLVDRLDSFLTISHHHLQDNGPLIGIGSVDVNPASTGKNSSQLSVQLTANLYQRSAPPTADTGVAG